MIRYGLYGMALVMAGMAMGGCAGLGAVYGIFIDPLIPAPTIKAEHDMSGKKALIWVDLTADSGRHPQLVRELTEQIAKELKAHKAVLETTEYGKIAE